MKKMLLAASLVVSLAPSLASATTIYNAYITVYRAYDLGSNYQDRTDVYLGVNGQYAVGENPVYPGVQCALWTNNQRAAEVALLAKEKNLPVNISYTTGSLPEGSTMQQGSVCKTGYIELAN